VFLTGLPHSAPDRLLPVVTLDLAGKPRGAPHPLKATAKYD
jgi:hypothetical protein